MTTPPTPEEVRLASFRVGFRGYDTDEVKAFLERLASAVEVLTDQRDRLASRLGEFAGRDLKAEFESVGREVSQVLETARAAAESLRERAAADAARWRSEAMAEAEEVVRAARGDAEAMRTDAWTTGSQLLDEVKAEVERLSVGAQRDALAVLGEGEREAHRLTSTGRRESEDLVRNARMEAEKLAAQARAEHDEIIASAHRQAESAQERTRALEHRREELMMELEVVRGTLARFESELEDRRQGLGLSEAPELPRQVVVADERGGEPHVETWEEGHTVRIIRPTRPEQPEAGDEDETEDYEDTDAGTSDVDLDAGMEFEEQDEDSDTPEDDGVESQESELQAEVEPDVESEVEPAADEVFELFRRLRTPEEEAPAPAESPRESPEMAEPEEPVPPAAEVPAVVSEPDDGDAFETRDRLLLPITNTALRTIKRVLTDAQNEALDQIRQSEGEWSPDPVVLGAGLRDELESLVADSAEAGLEAATELGVGAGPSVEVDPTRLDSLATELAGALDSAIGAAGGGTRERSAAASRVFRGWRTDEAERRVRWMAMTSYHAALASALDAHDRPWRWVTAGRSCAECRQAAASGAALPPAHRDCACTIEPTSA
ncbi:MAG TPA: DivIVA domain-containing protein [Acidimicrobiia bacterium]|nr:DivIVA domain-containing protein [Acidimicrobiia bacterium]